MFTQQFMLQMRFAYVRSVGKSCCQLFHQIKMRLDTEISYSTLSEFDVDRWSDHRQQCSEHTRDEISIWSDRLQPFASLF